MDTFGEWLRGQRTACKLTREEFAKRVGCSVALLRKIENGERRPSAQIAELMANCLNVLPEERSTFVRVARGELSVDRLHPELRPVATTNISPPKTNLPIFPTPLIGRAHQLEQLSQLLRDPQCRLLTLVGPGGIGKTRLSIEIATQLQDSFADGVYFVPLTAANSTRFIVPAVANSVGLSFHHANRADPKTQLFSYLKEKQTLFLIDNLEQLLIEQGIELLTELLAHTPQVKLLATSRECLGLQDEWVFEVHGLPVPESVYVEGSEQNTSVELFMQRARRAHVEFSARIADYPAIVRICQLVDGNPLGIELAAAWVRTLSCDEIAQEIERGMDFLAVSARDVPARHRSMRAVFEHSWRLLMDEEQRVLLRLSAFRGGFRREAAEQVAEATLPVLSALIAKSLARKSGDGRYDLHELIKQYASDQLAKHPDEHLRERHSRYYLTWIKEQEAALISRRQKETIELLSLEIDNLRQAWECAIDQRQIELLRVASWPLWYYYEVRGMYRDGEGLFLQAVQSMQTWKNPDELQDETQLTTLAYLQIFTSILALRQGRIEGAGEVLKHCLDPLRSKNDRVGLANALWVSGVVCMFMGRFQEAIECLQKALAQAQATHRLWEACISRVLIGRVVHQLGDDNESKRWLTDGLALGHQMGDPNLISFCTTSLVETELALGQLEEMESLLRDGIQIATDSGSRFTYAMLQEQLSLVLHSKGRISEAQELCRSSVDLYRELGDKWSISRALNLLGNFKFEEDEPTQALRFFIDALEVAYKAHSFANALDAISGIAAVQAINQEYLLAFELTLHVLQSPNSTHRAQNASISLLKELEARLTPVQIGAAKASAQAQTLDQIVDKVAHLGWQS
jgi:predicted ATPase/transcriptional regulator with XRE-family HTH domain